jgi:hypothetical protein
MDYGSEGWLEKGGLARRFRSIDARGNRITDPENGKHGGGCAQLPTSSPAVIDQYLEGTTIEDFGPAICAWSGPGISASTVKNKPF